MRIESLKPHQLYQVWSSEPEILVILDVRPAGSFNVGHIPGAVQVDCDRLESTLHRLPSDCIGVIVCSSEAPLPSTSHLARLHNAALLEGGFSAWFRAGLPCVSTPPLEASETAFSEQMNLYFERNRKEHPMAANMIFQQLFESETSTYTYLLADPDTREAILIDPVRETVDRDLGLLKELNLDLIYVLDTHVHADHVTAAGEIRRRTGAKTALNASAGVDCIDIPLEDGQELRFGRYVIKAITTPGHTDSCMSYYVDGKVFTGDTLLIRGTGRTDFQQGSSHNLYHSITQKLFRLPQDTVVYPGHDYRGFTSSTIRDEQKYNPRVGAGRSEAEFTRIMSELKLANPKKIHEAVPANLACGTATDGRLFHPQLVDGCPEITAEDLRPNLGKVRLIDVRRPEEFNNELGHIPGSELVTLGEPLNEFLKNGNRDEEIVFICRSGGRSGQATVQSQTLGYEKTINLKGGMLRWNELTFPVERT